MTLFGEDRARLQQAGRAAGSALRVHDLAILNEGAELSHAAYGKRMRTWRAESLVTWSGVSKNFPTPYTRPM